MELSKTIQLLTHYYALKNHIQLPLHVQTQFVQILLIPCIYLIVQGIVLLVDGKELEHVFRQMLVVDIL